MLARLSAFVIWALVAATAVFWGLRLWVRAPLAPSYTVAVGDAVPLRGDLTRLLGSAAQTSLTAAPPPAASSRFHLLGIMGPGPGAPAGGGYALIAVDGKLPRAYAVGASLDADMVLQSVSLRSAAIGTAGAAPSLTLEMPPLTAAATGRLPIGGAAPMAPLQGGQFVPPPPRGMTLPQMPQQVPAPGFAQPMQTAEPPNQLPINDQRQEPIPANQ